MAGVNSPKYRDYFITINEGAECYESALEIVKELNTTLWAFIVHDKDMLVGEDGEMTRKKTHCHIVIECKNPVSFEAMRRRFLGAHIETIKYKKSAYQYLIHNSPLSHEKYQYSLDEIISPNLEAVKNTIESETFELFKENQWLRYIAQGVRTPYQFVKRFGLNAFKQYGSVFADMLGQLKNDREMQEDLKKEIEAWQKEEESQLPF